MRDRNEADPEQLRQLYGLLDEALDLPPDDREAWLSRLGAEHLPLLPRLRSLLAQAGVETDDFMQRPAPARLAGGLPALDALNQPPDGAGDHVGPYRLISEIGAGGMATVWLAERDDGALTRQVALKLPRIGWSPGLLQRMARERDMLAALEHPHIARLYDAGVTPEGRPWLAMEFVQGQAIDAWCREHAASVPAILRLALQVCEALAHAHARLIVHRDLKPANILVTAQGEVRLVDFGVGKLLHEEAGSEPHLTQMHGSALTPDYASPEQVARKPLTVATDVYSLGVVLYELLTGVRPYKLSRTSTAALEEAILEADVSRASSRTGDKLRARALQGDLDAVLAKALAKDPARRYASAEALAADLSAHLGGRPVSAQAPGWRYLGRKFVGRHLAALSGAAVLVLALMGGFAGTAWQARQAERERDRAREELRFAQASEELLRFAFSEGAARPLSTRELLRRTETQLQRAYGEAPDLRARLQLALADLMREGNELDGAQRALDRARESARLAGGKLLEAKIDCQQAALMAYRGQAKEGQSLLAQARAVLVPATPDNEDARLQCHEAGAMVHLYAGDVAALRADAEAGLAIIGKPRPGRQVQALGLQSFMAEARARSGDIGGAIALYEHVLARLDELGRGNTSAAATVAINLAAYLARSGRPLKAARAYEKLLREADLQDEAGRATILLNHGRVLNQLGLHDQARNPLRAAAAQFRQIGNPAALTAAMLGLATSACAGADTSGCERALAEAEPSLALLRSRRATAAMPDLLRAQAALTELRYASAGERARAAIAQLDAAQEHGATRVQAAISLTRAEQGLGRLDAALEQGRLAVELARAAAQGQNEADFLGHALAALGGVRAAQGDRDQARSLLDEAVRHLEATLGPDAPACSEARQRRAAL